MIWPVSTSRNWINTYSIDVDPVYGSQLVTQLVSKVLQDGKKQVAQRIVYTALEGCREKTGTDPVVTLKRALDNVKPTLEVRSRRVGGATYQVPVEVRPVRRMALAMCISAAFFSAVVAIVRRREAARA